MVLPTWELRIPVPEERPLVDAVPPKLKGTFKVGRFGGGFQLLDGGFQLVPLKVEVPQRRPDPPFALARSSLNF